MGFLLGGTRGRLAPEDIMPHPVTGARTPPEVGGMPSLHRAVTFVTCQPSHPDPAADTSAPTVRRQLLQDEADADDSRVPPLRRAAGGDRYPVLRRLLSEAWLDAPDSCEEDSADCDDEDITSCSDAGEAPDGTFSCVNACCMAVSSHQLCPRCIQHCRFAGLRHLCKCIRCRRRRRGPEPAPAGVPSPVWFQQRRFRWLSRGAGPRQAVLAWYARVHTSTLVAYMCLQCHDEPHAVQQHHLVELITALQLAYSSTVAL